MKATQTIQDLVDSSFGIGKPYPAEIEFKTAGLKNGTCGYFIISKEYLIDICAWDNANCLDIMVFLNDKATEGFLWAVAGPCDCIEDFESRYRQLISWLEAREGGFPI